MYAFAPVGMVSGGSAVDNAAGQAEAGASCRAGRQAARLCCVSEHTYPPIHTHACTHTFTQGHPNAMAEGGLEGEEREGQIQGG
eukprot:scaffold58847_cov21-Tisochrysis_lutea.AAC.1